MKDDSIVDIERKAIAYLDKIRQDRASQKQNGENELSQKQKIVG